MSKDKLKFNHDYDIHGLAGYNPAGTSFYVDKDMPKTFTHNNKEVEVEQFLIIHELVEKTLEDKLGLTYEKAHEIANAAEKAAVEQKGISWKAYDAFMQKYIKKCEKEKSPNYPPDLEDPNHPGHLVEASSNYEKAYKKYIAARDEFWKIRDRQVKKSTIHSTRQLIANLLEILK
jgi:hypothetical protein